LPFKCNLQRYTKGEFNDLAALLLGLRDDIIANVLSVGSEVGLCRLNQVDP
jgi:hypothetical protein